MLRWVSWVLVSLTVGCGAAEGDARPAMFESSPAGAAGESDPTRSGIGPSVVASPRDTSTGASAAAGADDDVCSAMLRNVTVRVLDLPNGVRLTLTPHDPGDLADLRKTARTLEQGGGGSSSACALQNLGGHDARLTVTEQPDSVVLDVTTAAEHVPMIRQQMRELARNAGTTSSSPSGGQQGGQQGKGSDGP